ncbi:unnamed protein product [Trifolium pratense]|uniref:Uncharacterized protein n=1 Tax=Trifolium pratense TaxID=57577 RepID=A0ACB0L299_TRIPR|nr:unnamed protein product [Trifolium pratense]
MSMFSICPTSDQFLNLEVAILACRNAAAEHGYGLRLSTGKINRQGVASSRQLRIDRAGINESESKGIRHSGSQRSNVHSSVTRITEEEQEIIIRKSELGIRPSAIPPELRQEDSHATAVGVYNCLAKHRKQQFGWLGGRRFAPSTASNAPFLSLKLIN